jgi:hypothetical protein
VLYKKSSDIHIFSRTSLAQCLYLPGVCCIHILYIGYVCRTLTEYIYWKNNHLLSEKERESSILENPVISALGGQQSFATGDRNEKSNIFRRLTKKGR